MEPDEFWERLKEERCLTARLREELLRIYGERGRKALDAIDSGRVMHYRDFVVVAGSSDQYVVEDDFCTCQDFLYRRGPCWHLLAVRLATITGEFRQVG
jgi:predicted nucleic acid-binding Zn finger protein